MGVDILGTGPDSEVGKSFLLNFSGWHPLWDYTAKVCDELITTERYHAGRSNDGLGFTNDEARAIGDQLMAAVNSGSAAEYGEWWMKTHEADCVCVPCSLTGPQKECRSCRGTGLCHAFDTGEEFSDTVQQFAEFCLHCGGFQIW